MGEADQKGEPASVEFTVIGEPIAVRSKKTPAYRAWVDKIREVTGDTLVPQGRYRVRMEFVLPTARFQQGDFQNPHGKDLDNLIIPVFDALSQSILIVAGGDGAIWELAASKHRAAPTEPCGVRVSISALTAPGDAGTEVQSGTEKDAERYEGG